MTIRKTTTLANLLTHLYVLIPVFDNREALFRRRGRDGEAARQGRGMAGPHPEKDEITRRYLRFRSSLYRMALARLVEEEEPVEAEEDERAQGES